MPELPPPELIFIFLGLILFWTIVAAALPVLRRQRKAPDLANLGEASMNFDTDGLRKYLERLPPMIDEGYGPRENDRVMRLVRSMAHNDERWIEFPITHSGRGTRLFVSIFMDDIDAPDVAIFTEPELAQRIMADMIQWADIQEIQA